MNAVSLLCTKMLPSSVLVRERINEFFTMISCRKTLTIGMLDFFIHPPYPATKEENLNAL